MNAKLLSALGLACLVLGQGGEAEAAIYEFEELNPIQNAAAGTIERFYARYDDGAERLSWEATFSGTMPNGFWLVLSDGPNPKNLHNEYAIFYGDAINGTLTSYVYNGVNGSNSWQTPGEYIESFALQTTDAGGVRTMSFDIDVAGLNAYTPSTPGTNDWDGARFAESVGGWFHPAILTGIAYTPDGRLSQFDYRVEGWYDREFELTSRCDAGGTGTCEPPSVPEPGTLAVLGFGVSSLCLIRRRWRTA